MRNVSRAITDYELITANDTVLVAVSGGKDSMTLLYALHLFLKHSPISFTLKAVFIDIKPIYDDTMAEYIQTYCNSLNILYYSRIINIDLHREGKSPCYNCSWARRKALFEAMREYDANKLAFGHHLDDAVETLLMNITFNASISSIPAKFEMRKGGFSVIRPIIYLQNAEIAEIAKSHKIPFKSNPCPYTHNTKRNSIKQLITQLTGEYSEAKKNIFRSMGHICSNYLPENKIINEKK